MIVYRIENSMGMGPWRSGAVERAYNTAISEGSMCPSRHPCPHEDPGLSHIRVRPEHFFGFDSIDQYKRWFTTPGQRKSLAEKFEHRAITHVKLVMYNVPSENVHVGKHQVIFTRDFIQKIGEFECDAV